jgi:pyruvate/2-oxoglutarate dehydrogenase complex dihydrolipoamide dehydrogenase (E3) component
MDGSPEMPVNTPTSTPVAAPAPPQALARFPVAVPPMDRYNQALLENARPPAWRNPTPSGRYNLVVIGSGTAGLVASIGGAGLGGKVALIERHLMGGDCLNAGCVPSKAIIRAAKLVGELRRAEALGISIPAGVEVDFGAVMERMRRIRAEISHDDSVARVTNAGVELYFGTARFVGPNTIELEHEGARQTLEFAKAVIASGSSPRKLSVPGAEEVGYLTNETLFQLTELPRRLAVIGAGPIGSEMAQTFARLGSEVTLLERSTQILGREDVDAAKIVQAAFVRDGIELVFEAEVSGLRQGATGKVMEYSQNGETHTLEVDEVLVSIGRVPNVTSLNLEAAEVAYSERGVQVDDTLRTTNPHVYAAGDVGFRYQFTHAADATARIVLQNALFPGPKRKASDLIMPWTTYTDPEVAHTGLYAHQAEAQGIRVQTFFQPLAEVDRARTDGEDEGFIKLHVKAGSDKILGATIVAAHAGEMISEITTAMVGGMGLGKMVGVIHPYPTQTEGIRKIANQYNRSRLSPLVKRVLEVWMGWRR